MQQHTDSRLNILKLCKNCARRDEKWRKRDAGPSSAVPKTAAPALRTKIFSRRNAVFHSRMEWWCETLCKNNFAGMENGRIFATAFDKKRGVEKAASEKKAERDLKQMENEIACVGRAQGVRRDTRTSQRKRSRFKKFLQ